MREKRERPVVNRVGGFIIKLGHHDEDEKQQIGQEYLFVCESVCIGESRCKQVHTAYHIEDAPYVSLLIVVDQSAKFPNSQSCNDTEKNQERSGMDTNPTDECHDKYNAR